MPTLFESSPKSTPKATPLTGLASKMRPLSAFALEPTNVHFETQEAKETVELFLRQHPIVNLPWIIITAILVLVPVVVFPFIFKFFPIAIPGNYLFVGVAFWYLATFGYALVNFLYWFFNIYIVTNERLIDIDFIYLLYKRFSQAELAKIQDLSFAASGLFATIFDYGNANIETAGEAPNLLFEKIPHPEKAVETIRSLRERGKGESL